MVAAFNEKKEAITAVLSCLQLLLPRTVLGELKERVKKGFCDRNSSGGFSGFCKGFWKQIDADFKTNKDILIIPPGQIPTSMLL